MTSKEQSIQDSKNCALDRLKDALALYEKDRYVAVIYMCGYVIELGIKSEFHRLGNIPLCDVKIKPKSIINLLFKDRVGLEWMNSFSFPSTIFEFATFIRNIAIKPKLTSGNTSKELGNVIQDSNEFSVILSNRQQPSKDGESTFHNITGFLTALNDWKDAVGEEKFSVEDYCIDKKLGWSTNLRYGETSYNNGETSHNNNTDADNAEAALKMSIRFLKEVLRMDHVAQYEDFVYTSNYNIHNTMG